MRRTRHRRGLAAFEAVLLLLILAAGMALLAGQAERSRSRLRESLADRQIVLLREAMAAYHRDTGLFPPGEADFAAGDAFDALQRVDASARLLQTWPAPAGQQGDAHVDPWRRPYRYLAGENAEAVVAENGGWPVFVSAGPDGRFGGSDGPSARADDRRTDELRTTGSAPAAAGPTSPRQCSSCRSGGAVREGGPRRGPGG